MLIIDQSQFIQNSIDNVQKSALWGGLLAVLILYLFLRNGSTTFIIALSIPISLIATFGLLYFNGFTLNQMSFGGLALGIGLIVDNAIVVLDNIVRLRENGKSLRDSALIGTSQVAGAIIASTLTTSVIFLPVVFMRTISGMLFQELALVVVFALLCSLLVALTLVPMLARRYLTAAKGENVGGGGPLARFGAWFRGLEDGYGRKLDTLLRHRHRGLPGHRCPAGRSGAAVAAAACGAGSADRRRRDRRRPGDGPGHEHCRGQRIPAGARAAGP